MSLLFVAGIYFFARGIFALFGQPLFYTKRSLEAIDEKDLPAYLKEVGRWYMVTGVVFVLKAMANIAFEGSKASLGIFIAALVVCVLFLSKSNEKYLKK